jgi:predicted Zn-dependent protease
MGTMIPQDLALYVRHRPMSATSKRLEFLKKLTTTSSDPFAWYGLAMEYRSLELVDDAVATFTALRARNPDYVAMYLMAGQTLEKAGRAAEAREWLTAGMAAANAKGDSHAAGELESALAALA